MRVIDRTWASVEVDGVQVIFYRGGPALRLEGRRLTLPVGDDLPNTARKTLACFEHVLERFDFDVIFRTNCSSYVDLPNLRSFVSSHARASGFYAGGVSTHDGVPFASGSGYFLSRDLVELATREHDAWDHSLLDDVALGAVLAHAGIEPQPAPRRDYGDVRAVHDLDISQFHFRCRTDSWRRLGDARVMVALHRAFCDARGLPMPLDLRAVAAGDRLVTSAVSKLRGSDRQ
jgi:hypothetical protein